ncbi:MAG: ATP-binding protein [Bacillota bacterium]|nr:ATP-binding protein [Bacillota bacterium]
MNNKIEIRIPPLKEYIPAVRFTAALFANHVGFDIERIEDIKLVVGEACNNAVLYGDPGTNEISIQLYVEQESMFVDIIDKGYGFEIGKYKDPNLDEPDEGGFGIYIIKTLSDAMEIKSNQENGTFLNIRFNLV